MFKENLMESKYYKLITNVTICHRLPERTFNIKGHYFPVCSRCTGLLLGFLSFFIFLYFNHIPYSINLLIFSVLIMFPTVIDGYTQLIGLRESNNALRFFTGLIGGIGMVICMIIFFKFI
jgi:uncharacterized membrane protein